MNRRRTATWARHPHFGNFPLIFVQFQNVLNVTHIFRVSLTHSGSGFRREGWNLIGVLSVVAFGSNLAWQGICAARDSGMVLRGGSRGEPGKSLRGNRGRFL